MKYLEEMKDLLQVSQNQNLSITRRNEALSYLIRKCNWQGICLLDFIEEQKNLEFAKIGEVSQIKKERLATDGFICQECGQGFGSQNSLNAHLKKHKK
jgi:hypothetical protein